MKRFYLVLFLLVAKFGFGQTTIVDYDFNSSNTSPTSTAGGVTSLGSSDQTISYNAGVVSGGSAFTANGTAGQDMSIVSGNVSTHYFQFQLGGANLNTYCCYKLYFQIKSSATGATSFALKYSTDGGSTYTTYTTVAITTSFVEHVIDLCSVTALNNQSSIYFQLNTSGGSGAGGTTAIDNFEVQAASGACSGSCTPPTSAATGVNYTGVNTTSLTTNWTSGNGADEVVVISTSSTPPAPSGGTTYTGNTVFGSGSTMGAGYYTVYSGVSATSINVTGLTCGTTYYTYIFEYNNTGSSSPCYYTTSAISNTTTPCPCSPPTANTGTNAAVSVGTTTATIKWGSNGGGNGADEIVVMSTNNTAPSPVAGTTYAASTVYGSGAQVGAGYYTVYNGISASVATGSITANITGLTCGTTYYIYIIEYNNTGTSSPCYKTTAPAISSLTTSACPCVPPTTAATGISFSGISTTALTTNWTSGNGVDEVVVISTSSTPPTPSGGTTYTGNTVFGSGSTMGAGYYTVYSGVSATSVNITGLTCGVTYYTYIFEYNNTGTGNPCYYTMAATSNTITSACGGSLPAYPVLTGIVVDGCNSYTSTPSCGTTLNNSNCSEGRSEVTFFTAGTTSITPAQVVAMTRHVIDYYTTAWSTLAYYSGLSMNNTATTTYMNANGCNSGTCGSCFVDAYLTGIPAGATFIMVADYYCLGNTNYANLCSNASTSPIYVIYFGASKDNSSDCKGGTTGVWDMSGNYTNASGTPSVKGIAIDMSSLVAGAPEQYYSYQITSLVDCGSGSADGGGVAFNGVSTSTASPITPDAYTSCACDLNIVLPVSLLNFTAAKAGENIELKWATAEEVNNDYFVVEYSLDGENFNAYKQIKGAGNSTNVTEYNCLFTQEIGNKVPYFRLKQVDFNGKYQYSAVITLGDYSISLNASKSVFYYNSDKDKVIAHFKLDYPQNVMITLLTAEAQEIYNLKNSFNEGENEVQIPSPDKSGVYLIVYQPDGGLPVHKKIMVVK